MKAKMAKQIFLLVLICMIAGSRKIYAESVMPLSQTQALGLAESDDYRKVKSKIALKEVKYKEAVKSIQLKKKNMSTFRWTPLLSFKFPEKAALADEYEFIYKPLQIQSEIRVLEHQLTDVKYEVREEISNLYTEIYTYQEKISNKTARLETMEENLKRNQAKVLTGQAKQSDVDKIESSITALQSSLAADMRAFESGKSELSDLTGIDLTTGYRFENPYKEATIERSSLDQLIQATLDRSQSYYEAKQTTKLALTSVDTNYSLMQNQYGSKMGYISSYVQQAKNGEKIKSDLFRNAYDQFLKAIDDPWQGTKRILFIKIPKEWFKGSIDGVRYVEDDPYILYTNVLEYQEALSDQKSLEKEITKSVEDAFENLVTAGNSYHSIQQQTQKAKEEMDRGKLKNQAGELEFEEYETLREAYEELQISELEALELYTTLLYSFDRLTCGAVTELLNGEEISLEQGSQGESFVADKTKPSYYITTLAEDNLFELGIYLPEESDIQITHFELWVDNVQIGERTEIDAVIRHLELDLSQTDKTVIRLYNGDEFVADCEIDPDEYQGSLNLPDDTAGKTDSVDKTDSAEPETKQLLGTYKYSRNKKTGLITFDIQPQEGLNIEKFRLLDAQGKAIYSDTPAEVGKGITYLAVLGNDLENVRAELYDKDGNKLYTARLDTKSGKVVEE